MKLTIKQLKQMIKEQVEEGWSDRDSSLDEPSMSQSGSHKVVYHPDYGGFGLSSKILAELSRLGLDIAADDYDGQDSISRHDPRLVAAVEKLKPSSLAVATIKGNKYRIDEYDGAESVMEPENYDWVTVD